jgi:biotin carboxyl carrier protein
MPGNILDVKVTVGQAVKSGDVLLILEAMKMENEIKSPRDGVIASIAVTKGATVDTGAQLLSLS